MSILNSNDFLILTSIRDKENNLGFCEARGMTREAISSKTNLSMSTVIRSTKKLMEDGLISEGIKQINKKTYYVTEKGKTRIKIIFGGKVDGKE